MTDAQNEIAKLAQSLKLEQDAELENFESFLANAPVKKRVSEGRCWYPIDVVESGYGLGDYPYVIVERAASGAHQFGSGNMVRFFSNKSDYEGESCKGTVQFVDGNRMKISLHDDRHPDWIDSGKVGVDQAPDLQTFREMAKALSDVLNADKGRLKQLREVLFQERSAGFESMRHPIELPHLNESQNLAINTIVRAEDVAVIHGPPGTGKTTTLVAAIAQLVKREKRVLVCAPSNAATDLLALRCRAAGLKVARIGNLARMDDDLVALSPAGMLEHHPEAGMLKDLRKRALEMRRMAGKYKRNFGAAEREQRRALYREARDLGKEVSAMETNLIDQMLRDAQVVCCTPVGSSSHWLSSHNFKTVIIDEAAQALEPICWIPIRKAEKVVLAGDPLQLPPTVKSHAAAKAGLSRTMIERCIANMEEVCLLDTQYRMHEHIMGFSNQRFYDGQLKAHSSVASHTVEGEENQPFEFVDTAGCGFEEEREDENSSTANPGEANILIQHLQRFIASYPKDKPKPNIGIISPYKAQVICLKDKLKEEGITHVAVNTVDGFQGQERDVIYISTVRSNPEGTIGFLSDYRRMNVALTRARKKLVVIGDSATLGSQDFYQQFLDYAEKVEGYRSAWEFMT